MKKMLLAAIMLSIMLALAGCGGGSDNSPPLTFSTDIPSELALDGDILKDSSGNLSLSLQGSPSVLAGIDPITFEETRAFLGFPLTGVGGVPGNAIIVSANLNIVIDRIYLQSPNDTIPIRIELVSFLRPLEVGYFDRIFLPELAATTIIPPISRADVGPDISVDVDVTSLMKEAQRLGLPDFQIRILEDFRFTYPGLIEINDDTSAPLLQVVYF